MLLLSATLAALAPLLVITQMLRGAGQWAGAGDTYCLVGENTNKGKCYAEREREREREKMLRGAGKGARAGDTYRLVGENTNKGWDPFLSFRSFMSFKGRKGLKGQKKAKLSIVKRIWIVVLCCCLLLRKKAINVIGCNHWCTSVRDVEGGGLSRRCAPLQRGRTGAKRTPEQARPRHAIWKVDGKHGLARHGPEKK